MFLNSLSGRLLVLTMLFVMLAEVFIFVPSIARFRQDWLGNRLERAQIASLALLADDMIEPELERELLKNAGVYNVALRRDEMRELILSSPMPQPISATYDLRDPSPGTLIADAIRQILTPGEGVVRVIGNPAQEAGLLIEVTVPTAPLRAAMIDYGLRILALSAIISIVTAALLFFAVRRFMVKPIKGVVQAMQSYAAAPEDARRIIVPSAGIRELAEAERALEAMQTELTSVLRQRERLAALGSAVAKISHDLRNILTSAQLFADRIESSTDPVVGRMVPKLMGSIGRAVSLCETTLAFGRAEEPPPQLARIALAVVVDDVVSAERLAGNDLVAFHDRVPPSLHLRADPEQLHRVLQNLVRNARQAIEATGATGEIAIGAGEDAETWWIEVSDTGPGIPPNMARTLFQPFQSARKGGSGLGLAIAAELVRGHGGTLELLKTSPEGTAFRLTLPKSVITRRAESALANLAAGG